ncbi:MAG: hypothetical protein WAK20_01995 [Candidatus Acidiferrum sp.]
MAAKPDTPNPADQGWHVDVAPYLRFPGISGTIGAAGYETGVHVTGSDVLSYVNFGTMGVAAFVTTASSCRCSASQVPATQVLK